MCETKGKVKKIYQIEFFITGKTEIAYVAKETPMVMYLNAHGGLETLRRFEFNWATSFYIVK